MNGLNTRGNGELRLLETASLTCIQNGTGDIEENLQDLSEILTEEANRHIYGLVLYDNPKDYNLED